jgi:hypothetical protein
MMIATQANVIAFQEASNAALVAYCEAAGCTGFLRKAYAATYLRDNPKHGLAILREMLAQTEQATRCMEHFQSLAPGLMADIEAALPPENPTTEITQP